MKVHVLGVPHTITTVDGFTTCAFTQKVVNLCKMMTRRGHEVYHYGVEGSDPECTESVDIIKRSEWKRIYGKRRETDYYETRLDGPIHAPYMARWASAAKAEMLKRMGKANTEIVCLTWNGAQQTACEGVPQFLVESGIGYRHAWSDYRVYESYAWMHMHLGAEGLWHGQKWYWSVIPNAFDTKLFQTHQARPSTLPDEYFLYLGRLNDDKGIGMAISIAKEAGSKLILAGQGDPTRFLKGNGSFVLYQPPVGAKERAELLTYAKATFCLSYYVEPFCGTHVESMLCSTPVITTDWGVFNETVLHGVTGYRCRTYEQMVWAAKNVDNLDRNACYEWASTNYSLERVALMYEEYFQQVLNIRTNTDPKAEGLYSPHPDREQLDWLKKDWPAMNYCAIDLSIKHIPPKVAPLLTGWAMDQKWESEWWGLEPNEKWEAEKVKQETYARLMGFPTDYIFGEEEKAEILDVGCGPISLLQRTVHGPSRGIDPLPVSRATLERYLRNGVEFLNIKAEDMPLDKTFDEVWMYNCLQHVDNPEEILRRIAQIGKSVRIFEWLDCPPCPGHPHTLTEAMFLRHFGQWKHSIWNIGYLRGFDGCADNKYIAIHSAPAVRLIGASDLVTNA